MKNADAIALLIDLAQRNFDDRARALGAALRGEINDHERLQLLTNYRTDYMTRYGSLCQDGSTLHTLVNFQRFLEKLDTAIAQQREALEHSRLTAMSARAALNTAIKKRESLVVLRNRRNVTAQLADTAREQKNNDEWTASNGFSSRTWRETR